MMIDGHLPPTIIDTTVVSIFLRRPGNFNVEIEPGECAGTEVRLTRGDSLSAVPDTHQFLFTDEIREVFSDPTVSLKSIIDRCPFEEMSKWLRELQKAADWQLVLYVSDFDIPSGAGFRWFADGMTSARIDLVSDVALPENCPEALRTYYNLVDTVTAVYGITDGGFGSRLLGGKHRTRCCRDSHSANGGSWSGFCVGGSLVGREGVSSNLSFMGPGLPGADVNLDQTFLFGDSPCGDMIIWTADGRAGWFSHESFEAHFIGTIEDTINWVYRELRHDRCPEWNYAEW